MELCFHFNQRIRATFYQKRQESSILISKKSDFIYLDIHFTFPKAILKTKEANLGSHGSLVLQGDKEKIISEMYPLLCSCPFHKIDLKIYFKSYAEANSAFFSYYKANALMDIALKMTLILLQHCYNI